LPARAVLHSLAPWAAFAALNSVRASMVMEMLVVGHWRLLRRLEGEARLLTKCLMNDGMTGADLGGPRQPHNSSQLYPSAASFNQSIRGESVV